MALASVQVQESLRTWDIEGRAEHLPALLIAASDLPLQVLSGRRSDAAELSALVHQGQHVARAQHELDQFLQDLLAEAATTGDVRADVEPEELAAYCIHAVTAASSLPSKAAVRRLVMVTLAGLRPAQ